MEGFKIVSPEMRKMLGDLFDGESSPQSAKGEKIKTEDIENIEIDGVLYVTTARIAKEYEVDVKIIANNFNRNKDRYIEGKHYICLQGEKLKAFKTIHQFDEQFKHSTKLYLWTERGAFLHAKSLNVDKAWEAYEKLVEVYFRAEKAQAALRDLSPHLQLMIKLETEQNEMRKRIGDMEQKLEALSKSKAKLEAAAKKSGITGKPWSEREKDFLRDAFQMGLSDLEIAAKLDRTEWAISNKRRKMDMYHANGSKHWTKAEVKKLKRLHGMGLTAREIGQIVGKTTSAVNAKVCKLRKDGKL